MTYKCFSTEISDGVGHLRMIRADELNSMIPEFWSELPQAIEELEASPGVRVIVISSMGRHFTSGMDLKVFQTGNNLSTSTALEREKLRRLVLKLQDSFTCLESCRVPVIAAIQGGCIGAGVDMVSACDMRYATSDSFFCIQEINLAMMADLGTLQRLPKLIPDGIARELAYTGDRLPAERASSLGLVNGVFGDQNEMISKVLEVAKSIAERSPLAVSASKAAINYARDHSVSDALNHAADVQAAIFDGQHLHECFKAKTEKREPIFPDLLPTRIGI